MSDLIDRDALLKYMCGACLNPEAQCIQTECYLYREKKRIEAAPAVNRWISCRERMPEAGMPVLIYACKHRVTAYYDNCKNLFRLTENDNLYYIAEYVTYWMPLPEPPEKE